MDLSRDLDDPWGFEDTAGSSSQTSQIAVAGPDDVQDDEFETSDFDASSVSKFGSVSSSIYRHAYENGRRVNIASFPYGICEIS